MKGNSKHNNRTTDILSQCGFVSKDQIGKEDSCHGTKSDGKGYVTGLGIPDSAQPGELASNDNNGSVN
jgi:hypothetical protein